MSQERLDRLALTGAELRVAESLQALVEIDHVDAVLMDRAATRPGLRAAAASGPSSDRSSCPRGVRPGRCVSFGRPIAWPGSWFRDNTSIPTSTRACTRSSLRLSSWIAYAKKDSQTGKSFGPPRQRRVSTGEPTSQIHGDRPVRTIVRAVVEQERLVHDGDGGTEIRQRPWKSGTQLVLGHVVATLRDPLLHARDRERVTLQADEDQEHGGAARPRLLEQPQLAALGVGEDGLRAEGEPGLHEGHAKSLGLGEGAAVDLVARGARIGGAKI